MNISDGKRRGKMMVYISDRTRTFIKDCERKNIPVDFKTLLELRKQWEFDYKIDNNLN
jgi:hypothetical protein